MLQALERRERRLLLGVQAVFYFERYVRHLSDWMPTFKFSIRQRC